MRGGRAVKPSRAGGGWRGCRRGGTPSAPMAVKMKIRVQIKPRRLSWLCQRRGGRVVMLMTAMVPAIAALSQGVALAMMR